MDRAFKYIGIVLAVIAGFEVISGFTPFLARLDDILSPNRVVPGAWRMFFQGILHIPKAAPTLLFAVIFYHTPLILDRLRNK